VYFKNEISASSKGGDFREPNIYSVHGGNSMIWGPEQVRNSLSLFFTSSILSGAKGLFKVPLHAEIDE
jgi:hypothetical protein